MKSTHVHVIWPPIDLLPPNRETISKMTQTTPSHTSRAGIGGALPCIPNEFEVNHPPRSSRVVITVAGFRLSRRALHMLRFDLSVFISFAFYHGRFYDDKTREKPEKSVSHRRCSHERNCRESWGEKNNIFDDNNDRYERSVCARNARSGKWWKLLRILLAIVPKAKDYK